MYISTLSQSWGWLVDLASEEPLQKTERSKGATVSSLPGVATTERLAPPTEHQFNYYKIILTTYIVFSFWILLMALLFALKASLVA